MSILIETGLLQSAAQHLGTPCKAAIITDSQVGPLYAQPLKEQLEGAGFAVLVHAIPAGEASKGLETYGELLSFLAGHRLTRSDLVIALGGGVVGDIAGFVAATYLRGIRLAQIPTTLLAQVDSSVGGKTGIDLQQGKNLAGAFYQPQTVLIDPQALDSLPYDQYRNGLAEVVKYGVIQDAALFDMVPYEAGEQEEVIRRCVQIKQDIVARDERDRGDRQLLNFGHTFGHAVEHLSGYSLLHGEAVAIGMSIMARACAHRGLCPQEDASRLLNALHVLGLPTRTEEPEQAIFDALLVDKKRMDGGITLVLMRGIGDCFLQKMSLQEARDLLHDGLSA